MKILVVGDSYCPWRALGSAIDRLAVDHEVTRFDVVDEPAWRPTSPSEQKVREYLGSPRQVIERLDGHEVLIVQGAPVTDAVMDACPGPEARMRRPRRPRERRHRRRHRARHRRRYDSRQERAGSGRADHRLHGDAGPTSARGRPVPGGRGRAGPRQLRGRQVDGPRPGRPRPGPGRLRPDRPSSGAHRNGDGHARRRLGPVRAGRPDRGRRRGAGRPGHAPRGRRLRLDPRPRRQRTTRA